MGGSTCKCTSNRLPGVAEVTYTSGGGGGGVTREAAPANGSGAARGRQGASERTKALHVLPPVISLVSGRVGVVPEGVRCTFTNVGTHWR